jgi:hypothetical protein
MPATRALQTIVPERTTRPVSSRFTPSEAVSIRPGRSRSGNVSNAKATNPARTPSTAGGGGGGAGGSAGGSGGGDGGGGRGGGACDCGGDGGGGAGGWGGVGDAGGGDGGGAGGGDAGGGGGAPAVPARTSIRSQVAGNAGPGPAEVAITPTAITGEVQLDGTGSAESHTRGCVAPPLVTE